MKWCEGNRIVTFHQHLDLISKEAACLRPYLSRPQWKAGLNAVCHPFEKKTDQVENIHDVDKTFKRRPEDIGKESGGCHGGKCCIYASAPRGWNHHRWMGGNWWPFLPVLEQASKYQKAGDREIAQERMDPLSESPASHPLTVSLHDAVLTSQPAGLRVSIPRAGGKPLGHRESQSFI